MRNKKAFSLIEIAISIALLGVVIGAMLTIFSQGQRYARKVRLATSATFLIQEKLEELYTTDSNLFTNPDSYDEARSAVSGFSGFERQVDVTAPYLGDAGLAHIAVTVWWQGEKGERWRMMETAKANY
jgi:prepilin-type N-terminal cleavage/methylation domain-containing protein